MAVDPLILQMRFDSSETDEFDSVICTCPPALFSEMGDLEALDLRLATAFLTRLAQDMAENLGRTCGRADYYITTSPEVIRDKGLMHDCQECRDGVQRALEHLEAHPGTRFIVGQLHWVVIGVD